LFTTLLLSVSFKGSIYTHSLNQKCKRTKGFVAEFILSLAKGSSQGQILHYTFGEWILDQIRLNTGR